MLLINDLCVKSDYSNVVPKTEPQSNVLCLKKALWGMCCLTGGKIT